MSFCLVGSEMCIRDSNAHTHTMHTHACGGEIQLAKLWASTPLRLVQFLGAVRDFSSRVNFQCRISYGVHTAPCAVACINICAHIKGPVVCVRVQWIMETLAAGFPRGKQFEFHMGEVPVGQYSCEKKKINNCNVHTHMNAHACARTHARTHAQQKMKNT